MVWFAWYLAFTLFLAGLVWFPCCGGTAECTWCSADSDSVSVTLAGFTNGTFCTNCAGFNTTYVLAREAGTTCSWHYHSQWKCDSFASFTDYDITATAVGGGAFVYWQVLVTITTYHGGNWTNYILYRYVSDSSTEMDCTVERNPDYLSDTNPANDCADLQNVTCQIN